MIGDAVNDNMALRAVRDALIGRLPAKLDEQMLAGSPYLPVVDGDDIIVSRGFFRPASGSRSLRLILPSILITTTGPSQIERAVTPEAYHVLPLWIGAVFHHPSEDDAITEEACDAYNQAVRESLEEALVTSEMYDINEGVGVTQIHNFAHEADFVDSEDRHRRVAVVTGVLRFRSRRSFANQGAGLVSTAFGEVTMWTPASTSLGVDVYAKAGGGTQDGTLLLFDGPLDNRLRYLGAQLASCKVEADLSIVADADALIEVAIALNGAVDEASGIERALVAGQAGALSVSALLSLTQNDYVEIWVKADAAVDVTVTKMTLTAVRLDG